MLFEKLMRKVIYHSLFIFLCLAPFCKLGAQRSIKSTIAYMQKNIPEGWSIKKVKDSVYVFNKLIYQEFLIDPPSDEVGFEDTLGIYIHFYNKQTKKEMADNDSMVASFDRRIKNLNYEHSNPPDTVFRGKRWFYDWVSKLRQLKRIKNMFVFIHVRQWSLNISSDDFESMVIGIDDLIRKEAEYIKVILIDYLK